MKRLTRSSAADSLTVNPETLVERVIQFGEGNFLRGFVDWAIHQANKSGHYDAGVVVLQPIEHGLVSALNEQDGLFTLVLRGLQDGEKVVSEEVITSVSRGLRCVDQWADVLACADDPNIDVVVSNTTEAGIAYDPQDTPAMSPPASFPGKLCSYLHRRFTTFEGSAERGMLIIPCELIDRNGDNLRDIVLRLADDWQLGDAFRKWVADSNVFVNTLVDRIVTGYPGSEESAEFNERWGYEDKLIVTAEPFHLWVIEGPASAADRFPVHKAGLEVLWVDDMTPYRTRKVRILNGAHTSTVATAYLSGVDFVKDAVEDETIGRYMRSVIFDEIIPTLDMAEEDLQRFADQVLERFQNPFIRHRWLDISLNSISKYKARVLPSLLSHLQRGDVPALLSFSLAATLRFYKGTLQADGTFVALRDGTDYQIRDDQTVLEYFNSAWSDAAGDNRVLAGAALSESDFWGEDLSRYPGLVDAVTKHLDSIDEVGVRAAVERLVGARN